MISSLDFLYIALSICVLSLTIPWAFILWRVYGMLSRIESVLAYIEHLKNVAADIEKIPLQFVEKVLSMVEKK